MWNPKDKELDEMLEDLVEEKLLTSQEEEEEDIKDHYDDKVD
jgi:hypothetical protein